MSVLDPRRQRIQDDLRGLVAGEVRCDDVFLQLYASDASIYEIKPLAVVCPRSTVDTAACLQYAAENGLPVHARGAGSGSAGESLGSGIVLDFSVHLRRIIRIDADCVRVQPGVVHQRLNEQLRPLGRIFGPDPPAGSVSTIGGMIAVDAVGSRWLKYGSTRDHVESLQVVMADGQVLEFGREPLSDGHSISTIPRKRKIIDQLVALLSQHVNIIPCLSSSSLVAHCGYNLSDVLCTDYINVGRLLAGSEGTLALITEATLRTQSLPRFCGLALLLFDSLEKAARAVSDILPAAPTACELIDRRHLGLAREMWPIYEQLIPAETEAALLVEQDGDDPLDVRTRLQHLVKELWQQKRIAFGARQAFEIEEHELFWGLVDKVRPALSRVKGASRPVPIIDDLAVLPELLPDFLLRLQNVLKRNQVTAALFAHAGHGQVHVQPFVDLADPKDVQRIKQTADELYEEVLAIHGSIGGEHACGLSRTAYVQRQAGPLYEVFCELKRIFDPANLLNPGKIIGDDPDLLTRYLRPSLPRTGAVLSPAPPLDTQPPTEPSAEDPADEPLSPAMRNLVELQLDWQPERVLDATAACNRCGHCRTQESRLRMCPIFRIAPAEEASPRAKANLIRGVLTGTLELNTLTGEEFKAVADLCVHCHACRLECPAEVDIPRLMSESKGAFVAANGLSPADWIMTRLDLVGSLSGLMAPVVNWALENRQVRWLLEKTLGISQGRKLPPLASRNFLSRAARRRLTRPSRRTGQKVLYFVDVFANYFDPQLAESLVAVLEHNGIAVYVHPEQRQAGMAAIAAGRLEYARALARHNVAVLADSIRQGYHVVATEPAAALCLAHEYPRLLEDDDARLVAANSSEACGYLWNMHVRGQLQLDFRPLNAVIGYHTPCHLRALGTGTPGKELLSLIPGLRVQDVEAGCSGMAGTFGLQHQNYRHSLRAGWKLISRLRHSSFHIGATECSACKLQMEQGANKSTLHPLKLLAMAYGLIPDAVQLLAPH